MWLALGVFIALWQVALLHSEDIWLQDFLLSDNKTKQSDRRLGVVRRKLTLLNI
jgi:hypothetical protein